MVRVSKAPLKRPGEEELESRGPARDTRVGPLRLRVLAPMFCLLQSLLEVSRCFYIFKEVGYIIMCAVELITNLFLSFFNLEEAVLFSIVKNQTSPLAQTLWQPDKDVRQHNVCVCRGFLRGLSCSELAQYYIQNAYMFRERLTIGLEKPVWSQYDPCLCSQSSYRLVL